jgi:hypothetical protein
MHVLRQQVVILKSFIICIINIDWEYVFKNFKKFWNSRILTNFKNANEF